MRATPALLLAILVGTGCASTVQVNLESDPDRAALGRAVDGRTGVLKMTDGSRLRVRELHVQTDSVSYLPAPRKDVKTQLSDGRWIRPRAVREARPHQEIASIQIRHRGKGALRGLRNGAITAVGGSVIIGSVFGSPGFITFLALNALPSFSLTGAAIGGVAGYRQTYRLDRQPYGTADQPPLSGPRDSKDGPSQRPD